CLTLPPETPRDARGSTARGRALADEPARPQPIAGLPRKASVLLVRQPRDVVRLPAVRPAAKRRTVDGERQAASGMRYPEQARTRRQHRRAVRPCLPSPGESALAHML